MSKNSGCIFTMYVSKNEAVEAVCCEVQTNFERFPLPRFTKKLWAHFHNYVSKNKAVCCEVQTYFGSSLLARFESKNSGCIFMMYASKNEAVLLV